MDRWKAETGRVREKRRVEERRSEKRKSQKKEAQMREKVGKSRNIVFFPMTFGSGGSKSRLAKAAGAEPPGQMRDEKVHAGVLFWWVHWGPIAFCQNLTSQGRFVSNMFKYPRIIEKNVWKPWFP